MYFKQFLDRRYGCASYVVASRQSHEGAIVDPSLDVEQYEALLHSGARSLRAAQFLRQVGFEQVANVQGGTEAWRAAGKTMAFGCLSADKLHGIGSAWAHTGVF